MDGWIMGGWMDGWVDDGLVDGWMMAGEMNEIIKHQPFGVQRT